MIDTLLVVCRRVFVVQGVVKEAERLHRMALSVLQEESSRRGGPVHVQVGATMVALADVLGKQASKDKVQHTSVAN